MTGLANVIIGLWFLPVTLFILIPLTILVAWLVYRATLSLMGHRQSSESLFKGINKQETFSQAQA